MEQVRELVEKARSGDTDAFGELYGGIWHDMYKYALLFLQNEHDAKDAVQQAALDAFCAVKNLNNPDSFHAWMFSILSRRCKKYIPELIRRRETKYLDEVLQLNGPDNTESLAEAQEVYAAIIALPPDDRQIILLRLMQGYSSAEIAKILKRPAGSIRSKLSRVLDKLRTQLEIRD